MPEVPVGVVTATVTGPAGCAGVVNVNEVGLVTVTALAGLESATGDGDRGAAGGGALRRRQRSSRRRTCRRQIAGSAAGGEGAQIKSDGSASDSAGEGEGDAQRGGGGGGGGDLLNAGAH